MMAGARSRSRATPSWRRFSQPNPGKGAGCGWRTTVRATPSDRSSFQSMADQPGTGKALWRGMTRRCARCGSGKLFKGWFHMVETCPRCGLKFEREAGYWAGALAINLILVGGLFAIVFITILVFTVPDIPIGLTLAIVIPIAVL